MRRRTLILDPARRTWRLESLRVETLQHDEREEYLTLHGEALCQYLLRCASQRLVIARGPMPFLAGNKTTVGYISPLTGVPHYSFVGGRAAAQLFDLGLDGLVLCGEALVPDETPYVVISGRAPDLEVRWEDAGDLPGGQRSAYYWLVEQALDGRAETGSVFCLGQGAGLGYQTANLAVEGLYHAGRGGAGTVFARFARALVLRGTPREQAAFFAQPPRAGVDPAFARSPNQAIARPLSAHTARLSSRTGGTVPKLYATGCREGGEQTLPSRNATRLGYDVALLGEKRLLAATRDGQTGCHWCPVDCRHYHWAPAEYAPGGRDRFLDDFEPTYAVFAMLDLIPEDVSFDGQVVFWREVHRRLLQPIEQLGCDVIDVGVGLAALFEGLEQGMIPPQDVPPELRGAPLGDLAPAAAAIEWLRRGAEAYPALRAVGDGPQALAQRYPAMQEIVFTCGEGTLGNPGHCNALWTFLMPFSRFFGHYSGQIYKIDETLPAETSEAQMRALFERVVARMVDRELFGVLCNALSCCAFTFVLFSQDGLGERLDDADLLVRVLAQYGIRTTRAELNWFTQAFWAQSIQFKVEHGWRPPRAGDLPRRVYEALSTALGQPPEVLERWMGWLIEAWVEMARDKLARFGYDVAWLDG
jgi:aldehyde:ferredoxin oxidoreductase